MNNSNDISHRLRINQAVDYILAHLEGPLDVDTIASVACLSRYHFHRVFLSTTGLTPAEYIEYARMNAIVHALRNTQQTVTTIASNVGFQSGSALAKALRRRYGLAPSDVRNTAAARPHENSVPLDIRAFRRPKHHTRLVPRIEQVPRQSVLCATEFGMENNHAMAAHARAIERVRQEIEHLNVSNEITARVLLIPDAPKGPNDPSFRTIAGFALKNIPSRPLADCGVHLETIGGGQHAIFTHKAPSSTVWQSWFASHHDWLPAVDFRLRNQIPFQTTQCLAGNVVSQPYTAEIFIPIE